MTGTLPSCRAPPTPLPSSRATSHHSASSHIRPISHVPLLPPFLLPHDAYPPPPLLPLFASLPSPLPPPLSFTLHSLNSSTSTSSSSSSTPPPQHNNNNNNNNNSGGRERSPDFFANAGQAQRTVREDFRELFTHDLDYSIYRQDIVFRDPTISLQGISWYKRTWKQLRLAGRILFRSVRSEVNRMWNVNDFQFNVRWSVCGEFWLGGEGRLEVISMYKLDKDGRVFEHAVDNKIFIGKDQVLVGWMDLVRSMTTVGAPIPQGANQPVPWPCVGEDEVIECESSVL